MRKRLFLPGLSYALAKPWFPTRFTFWDLNKQRLSITAGAFAANRHELTFSSGELYSIHFSKVTLKYAIKVDSSLKSGISIS